MNIFPRDIDEPEDDDSGFPRRLLIGAIAIGVAGALGLGLSAVGVVWLTADGRRGTNAEFRNRYPSGAPAVSQSSKPDLAKTGVQSTPWRVRPDRKPSPSFTSFEPRGTLTFSPSEQLVFPAAPSLLVASFPQSRHLPAVWSFATAEQVGVIRALGRATAPFAVSSNGRFVAGKGPSTTKTVIQVCSLDDVQPVRALAPDGYSGNLESLSFLDDNHLLAVIREGSEQVAHVWRISDGTLCGRFSVGAPPGVAAHAVSPGGQFLAVASGRRLIIHEFPAGEAAGRIDLARSGGLPTLDCQGLAFSPDVTELAGYCPGQITSRIVVWNLETGAQVIEHVFSADWIAASTQAREPTGAPIAWLADGTGWLVRDRLVIDRELGTLRWTVPRSDQRAVFRSAHVVGLDHLAIVEDFKDAQRVSVVSIPKSTLASPRATGRLQ